MTCSAAIHQAVAALSKRLKEDCSGFEELAQRLHRIEGCRLDGDVLSFELERHPDQWTSLQRFSFDVRTGKLQFINEKIVELHVSAESFINGDFENYFEAVGLDDFDSCQDIAAVAAEATKLAQDYLAAMGEDWPFASEAIENASSKIRAQWDEVRRQVREEYIDAFAARACLEWRLHH